MTSLVTVLKLLLMYSMEMQVEYLSVQNLYSVFTSRLRQKKGLILAIHTHFVGILVYNINISSFQLYCIYQVVCHKVIFPVLCQTPRSFTYLTSELYIDATILCLQFCNVNQPFLFVCFCFFVLSVYAFVFVSLFLF